MTSRTKYKYSTMFLVLLLLFLTLGYAYLTQTLNINGTSKINNATWNVYWDNVQVTEGSVAAETPVIDTNKTTVSYSVHLSKPGDFYEFTVDAKNTGTIDAMIESITSTVNNNPISTLPNYLLYSVTYSDDKEIENNHLLKANEIETYKVRVEYKLDVSPENLPNTNRTFSFNVTMSEKQANENATERKRYLNVEDLKALAIPSGEGLSLSTVEENRYIYRGTNPDNYIQLGEDMYRIISIEPDNTVKVVKNESIGKIIYDNGQYKVEGTTSTRRHSSSDYCYYRVTAFNHYHGCNIWGSSSSTLDADGNHIIQINDKSLPETDSHLNVFLNGGTYFEVSYDGWYATLPTIIKDRIVEHLFNIGDTSSGTAISESIMSEKQYKWYGKVGTIYASDYVQANSNIDDCGTYGKSSRTSSSASYCKNTNWLSYQGTTTVMTRVNVLSNRESNIFISPSGYLDEAYPADASYNTYPSFFLTSSLKVTGKGTQSNPYKLYKPS